MAELEASAQYEGLWSFMDADSNEQGPFTVRQLQIALTRGLVKPETMVHDEEDGVSLRLDALLVRWAHEHRMPTLPLLQADAHCGRCTYGDGLEANAGLPGVECITSVLGDVVHAGSQPKPLLMQMRMQVPARLHWAS